MLAELMRLRFGIAIAGAHGKTSTTSMVALVLERAGLDPTAVIGGRLSAFGSNARLGRGDYMVAEADESDGSFLRLSPVVAVITNVDREHLDHYGDFAHVCDAFVEFANRVPFYGAVIACVDDPRLRELVPRMTRRVITYGLDADDADLAARGVRLEAFGSRCHVVRRPPDGAAAEELGELHLRVPGRHNLQNALATVAVGLELGLPFGPVASALAGFLGAERRFQLLGEVGGVMVVDDYGHHPTEIGAVLAAARAGLDRRLLVVFQPHRYTRTLQLLDDFGTALSAADEIVLTDVYAAGEDPLPGATVEAVAAAVRARTSAPVHVVRPLEAIAPSVARLARPGHGDHPRRRLDRRRRGTHPAGVARRDGRLAGGLLSRDRRHEDDRWQSGHQKTSASAEPGCARLVAAGDRAWAHGCGLSVSRCWRAPASAPQRSR